MFGTWPTYHRHTENNLPPKGLGRKCEESYWRNAESWPSLSGSTERTWRTCCWSLHEDRIDHPIVAEGDVTPLCSFCSTLHNAVATKKSLGYSHDLASSTNMRAALQKVPGSPAKVKVGRKEDCDTSYYSHISWCWRTAPYETKWQNVNQWTLIKPRLVVEGPRRSG